MGPALSSCSSGPLCGPQGAAAPSSQDSGHLLGRGLGCGRGRLQPAPPLAQIPEECDLGQPWAPVTRPSSHPGTSNHSAKAGPSHKASLPHPDQSTEGGRAGVWGRGHPPQAQLPQSLKPGPGQEVVIIGRVRPRGGGPGGQFFRPGRGQLLWVHPSLGRERAGSGHSLPGLGAGGWLPPAVGAGCTWHRCRRSRRPLVGFPQRTRLAPGEEGVAGPGLGLQGFRAASH